MLHKVFKIIMSYLIGSFHMSSQAKALSFSGSESGLGILLISFKWPLVKYQGGGMPPCTQNIYSK